MNEPKLPTDPRDRAGNGLMLVAFVLVAAALVMGPVVVVTHSVTLLNTAITVGIIGVLCGVVAAVRSYIA